MRHLLSLLLLFVFTNTFAQQPPATSATERVEGFEKRKQLEQNSFVNQIPFRSAGPTVFSGRVIDVAVNPEDPTIFYVAYASGGLWKTENNGTSFSPIFDNEIVMTIGDIAVDWKNNVIWVGTGENNSSRSSYSGVGMFKSMDDGKNWEHVGLPESHHIGRIVLHPTDQNVAWVGVLGHLYSPNKERGVYKTTNGGKTWKQTLFVNENSGAVDLIIDPTNPQILYTATWHRERRSWNFVESGEGSGIHKSTDGGESWTQITSGFPTGEGTGRIGLDIHHNNGSTTLYAVLDNQNRRPKKKEDKDEKDKLTKDDLREMSKSDFLKLTKGMLAEFLSDKRFPKKYDAEKVIELVKTDSIKPIALVEFLEDANSMLFDTPVVGAEVYRSDDEGESWYKTHEDFLDNIYFSYGYYFGQIRINPMDKDHIYIFGVPILRSTDGGKTFESMNAPNVHVDHHALWVSPDRKGHLINGNDGGINISYDDGKNWIKCNSPAVGQFYSVNVDMEKPYNIYGGLQDNGVWVGSSSYKESKYWHNSGQYPYRSIMGGDGMHVEIDPRNPNKVYTGFQFGNYYRLDLETKQNTYITPKHDLGQRPYRWNWQSPIHLSKHQPDILYIGGNKLFRSFDGGDTFKAISEDLTNKGKKGNVAFGTLTSIHESPLQFGLIYVGSDDGLVHVTKDGGITWEKIITMLPRDMWVSRIRASSHVKNRVYLTLNGYRWDDFNAYVYRSDDNGKTWEAIGTDLPMEPVNVIKEDLVNPDLLYVGTDHGLYISLDRGATFQAMNKDLPNVAVHDLVVHPRDKDLILGTHGRSFYVAEVAHLQQLNKEILAKTLHGFDIEKVYWSSRWGNKSNPWAETKTPKISIPYFSKTAGELKITIKTDDGKKLKTIKQETEKGLNYFTYDGSIEESAKKTYTKWLESKSETEKEVELKEAKDGKYYLMPGTYEVEMEKDGEEIKEELVVEKR
ncbi:MAG: glycosyl hydrolase [Saprospiraceae bacterium]